MKKNGTRMSILDRSSSFLVHVLFSKIRVEIHILYSVRFIIIPSGKLAMNFACKLYEDEMIVAISRFVVNATMSKTAKKYDR